MRMAVLALSLLLASRALEAAPGQDAPRYGGVFIHCWDRSPLVFDEAFHINFYGTTLYQTNDHLLQGDLLKGPQGTNQASWLYNRMPEVGLETACLAESWELVDGQTLVFHIRKGVYFHNKPPTNGREMTADDCAFSLRRVWLSPKSYHSKTYPWKDNFQVLNDGPWIEATDKWTLVIKTLPGVTGIVYRMASGVTKVVPRDAVEQYGDLNDWRHAVGTGPFLLTDYVHDSSATFVRNPNFWMKDPRYPDNPLPYLDGVKYLIIPDHSTRIAALRTGKIDWIGSMGTLIGWEDAKSLKETNPELKYREYLSDSQPILFMRVDNPELPWHDSKVRRALHMAIDNKAIRDNLFGGHAELLGWPVMPVAEFMDMYTPMEQLPESTRELFEHHPEKAKKLLAEAGFPNGFKAEVLCPQANADLLSIIKAYWAEVGVDLTINVKEYGQWTGIFYSKKYKEMVMSGTQASMCEELTRVRHGHATNGSMVNDPVIEEAYAKMAAAYFDPSTRRPLMKEVSRYILSQAYAFVPPMQYQYTFWQPWVKGYAGEMLVGYMSSYQDFDRYVWIDKEKK